MTLVCHSCGVPLTLLWEKIHCYVVIFFLYTTAHKCIFKTTSNSGEAYSKPEQHCLGFLELWLWYERKTFSTMHYSLRCSLTIL